MDVEKVVVSAEDMSVVMYAEVGGIIIGIRLDPFEADRVARDLQDRAAIIGREIERQNERRTRRPVRDNPQA